MSQSVLTTFLNNATSYFTKVKRRLVPVVYETRTLAANSTAVYDLAALIPNLAEYNALSTKVTVLVYYDDPDAAGYQYYINSDAVITYGIKPNGSVIVYNSDTVSHQVIIQIDHPTVKST